MKEDLWKKYLDEAFQDIDDTQKDAIDVYTDNLARKLFKEVKKDVKKNKWPSRIESYILGRLQFYIDKPGFIGKMGRIVKGKQ